MQKTNLMAVQEEGQKLVMMDGTIWLIHPDEISTTVKWIPPCGIQITGKNTSQKYNYSVTNTDEQITVAALRRR